MPNRLRRLLLCALTSLWLAGCATLPDEGPRSTSTALPAQGPATPLDRLAQASMADARPGRAVSGCCWGPARSMRVSAALFDFARVNRRMHNKLFVADGVAAVTGGRNLGDEYFMRGAEANFFDYDVLAIGPVVPQMASLFDAYWNAPQVRTAASVLRPPQSAEALRHAFDARVDGPDTPDPPTYRGLDRLGRMAIADEIAAGRMQLQRGAACA